MWKKKRFNNFNRYILCGLIFFVIVGTAFCMAVDSREASGEKVKIPVEQKAEEKKKAEEAAEKERAEKEKAEEFSLQPGVPTGTLEPNTAEKVVYLTFDDGPSENTQVILDILDQYDAKATFFITGSQSDYRPLIRKAYDAGHTIGLHTYSHDYSSVYSSVDAYFEDLEKIGEVAEEQIGYVPCFIRFPGGVSNVVSQKYSPGIMTELTGLVQEKGYQYYDWNVDSGDGAGLDSEQIKRHSVTDEYSHPVILLHDSQTKTETVKALPAIIEYYKERGYKFRAIDRSSFVSHHAVLN